MKCKEPIQQRINKKFIFLNQIFKNNSNNNNNNNMHQLSPTEIQSSMHQLFNCE